MLSINASRKRQSRPPSSRLGSGVPKSYFNKSVKIEKKLRKRSKKSVL